MRNFERLQLTQAFNALTAAGWKLTGGDDGNEEFEPMTTLRELLDTAASVDFSRFKFEKDGRAGRILVVLGNGPDDGTIADYSVNLGEVLDALPQIDAEKVAQLEGAALDSIAELLAGDELTEDVFQILADILATTGRTLPPEKCPHCGLDHHGRGCSS